MLEFPHVQAKNDIIRLLQIERSGGAGTPRITTPKGLASMRSQSTPIACAIQLSGRNSRWTLIDFDDVERVSCHTWWADPSGRPYTTIKRRTVLLNRFVLNAQSGVEVDHVNGDVLDNRRGNLRLATRSENEANKGIQEQTIKNYLMDLYILVGVKNSPAFNRRVRLARMIWEALVHELVADLTEQEAA